MQSVPISSTPIPLQGLQWVLDPVGYLNKNFKRHGDIFQAHLLWGTAQPMLMVSEPKAVQYILTHDTGKEFTAPGEANKLLAPLIGWQNLMLLSGSQHRDRRQLVMPPFHGDRLKSYGQIIQAITQEVMEEWPTDQVLSVRLLMQKITMRVILQAVFGLNKGDRYQQLEQLLRKRLDMTDTPLASVLIFFPWLQKDFGGWSPGHRAQQLAAQIDQLLFAEIHERRANPDPERIDILSLLLATKDEEGKGLSDQDLRDELMALLVAGHETTATALTWAMYWIHSIPSIKQKLITELDSLSPSADALDLLRLPYLTGICNETLRIHPVAMLTFPRRSEIPLELCGYQLEPGTLVMGSIYLIHHREDLYPQPDQFRPERFLEKQFSPYEFMPFGGGVRRCIGSALAQYEMKIVLGTILRQLDLVLENQRPVAAGRRGVTLGPRTPVLIKKIGRRSALQSLVQV
ncbi:MAG: cytochrome P450 [Acaryochloridaceae cyanobacterium SU_2_1]|nr:cytochrome P450 [Acaryochloridaceae cyanobacterium SU_2_1]